jgi:hypothetical protein
MPLADHSDKVTMSLILFRDQDAWLRERARRKRTKIADVAREAMAAGIHVIELREQAMNAVVPIAPVSSSTASRETDPIEATA